MKKLILMAICLLSLCAFTITANASPSHWVHPEYDLTQITTINVTKFENNTQSSGNYTVEKNAQQNIMSALYAAASKQNLLITENVNIEQNIADNNQTSYLKKTRNTPKTVNLQITANKLGYSSTVIPAHFDNQVDYVKTKVKDSHGNYNEVSVPVTHQVYIPETTYYTAHVEIIYNLYDPANDTMIFTSRDSRERGGTYDTTGMLERSTKDLLKNIKKGK